MFLMKKILLKEKNRTKMRSNKSQKYNGKCEIFRNKSQCLIILLSHIHQNFSLIL